MHRKHACERRGRDSLAVVRSIEAAIDITYRLCSAREKDSFRRAHFPRDFLMLVDISLRLGRQKDRLRLFRSLGLVNVEDHASKATSDLAQSVAFTGWRVYLGLELVTIDRAAILARN